ncbi:putative ABC transporter ATP-binding protein [Leucobacter sp. 7(1)]|uniref:ABC-F family ATP-binding cassette domain-containing protein n=1 Tax=Leucobacter sp. 7(1) TaxID=1255613 RepID=UPI00097F1C8D|nr:ABC-F family ATP-binding cassette domain-containing protein [Leucobacter sp. 7(1)]SJN09840.1 putative ABC transporter ATP-binding protein [Leucobacter sp. 7(1)]
MPASPNFSTPSLSGATRAAAHATSPGTDRPAAAHLFVDGVSHSYPDRRVLSDISFTARPGDRIGLIGENGTGKSTLLRILAGQLTPSLGTVQLPGSVGLLAQELPYADEVTLSRVLDDAQASARSALAELDRLGAALAHAPADPAVADAYAEALDEAERTGAWTAEAHRGDILAGLGLGGISEERPIGQLSGGQRLRLSLAALLLEAPHTLLLDEPSNHLDDASADYLERVLGQWPGIVIVASHDRTLLDAITTRILDLDPLPLPASELADAAATTSPARPQAGIDAPAVDAPETDDPGAGFGARMWGVGYSAARAERRAELARWRAQYAAESAELEALRHEIAVGSREVNRKHESKSESRITKKFYADKDARVTSRRARNARVRLETLERRRVRRPPAPLNFAGFSGSGAPALGDSEHSARPVRHAPVIEATGVAVANRLAPVSLALPENGRILLAGPNGAGKSTLLAVLAGVLEPDTGSTNRTATLGYLPQEVVFPRPERTATQAYEDTLGSARAEQYPLVESGLIAARDLDRPVGVLSVGQRRRLALATLVADPPEILLLDEPSNHLSLTLVEELEQALAQFPGALIIATHDRWLRRRWQGEIQTIVPPHRREISDTRSDG